jgi:hypothetical protein
MHSFKLQILSAAPFAGVSAYLCWVWSRCSSLPQAPCPGDTTALLHNIDSIRDYPYLLGMGLQARLLQLAVMQVQWVL